MIPDFPVLTLKHVWLVSVRSHRSQLKLMYMGSDAHVNHLIDSGTASLSEINGVL